MPAESRGEHPAPHPPSLVTRHPSPVTRHPSPDAFALLALLVLACFYFWPVLLRGRVLLPLDNLYEFEPWKAYAQQVIPGYTRPWNALIGDLVVQSYGWKQFVVESLRQRQIPLWNPYLLGGVPFFAAGQYSVLYPGSLFFYLLPVAYGYGPFAITHLFLAGALTYALARALGARRWGALVGAVTFMLAGRLVTSLVWPQMVGAMVWLPGVLLAVERLCHGRGSRLLWALAGAALLALDILAGHLEITFYLLVTAGAFAAFLLLSDTPRARRPGVGLALAGMVALGLALGAVQLLPFAELIGQNARGSGGPGAVTLQEVRSWALPLRQAAAFLVPDVFGNPARHRYLDLATGRLTMLPSDPSWGIKDYVEGCAYLGVLPLLLALWALLHVRRRVVAFWGVFAAWCLLLAFGSPLYWLVFQVPGFNQIHSPFRWVYPYGLAVALLAALGLSDLQERAATRSRRWTALALLGAGLAVAAVLAGTWLGRERLAGPAAALIRAAAARGERLGAAFPSPEAFVSYEWFQVAVFAVLLLAGAALIALAPRLPAGWLGAAVVALTAADLCFFGMKFNTTSDARLLRFVPPAIQFLLQDHDAYRITGVGANKVLNANTAMIFGIADIRGYDTIIPRQYAEYMERIEHQEHLVPYSRIQNVVRPADLASPLIDLLNVKYAVSDQPFEAPGYRLVHQGGGMLIYENQRRLPRLRLAWAAEVIPDRARALDRLADPAVNHRRAVVLERPLPAGWALPGEPGQGEVRALRDRPNSLLLEARLDRPGLLVVGDSIFPGWQAWVDDAPEPVLRADAIFRAVYLPAGEHRVLLAYQPLSFTAGATISAVAALAALLLAGLCLWRHLRALSVAEMTTAQRIAKNSLGAMGSALANKVLDFGFALFMARTLQPEGMGKYGVAVTVATFTIIWVDCGLTTYTQREVAKEHDLANRYVINSIAIRLVLLLAWLPVVGGFLWWGSRAFALSWDTGVAIMLFVLGQAPGAVAGAFSSAFYAFEMVEHPSAMTLASNLLRIGLGITTLVLGWGVIGLGLTSLLVNLVTAVAFYAMARSLLFRPWLALDLALCRSMVAVSHRIMLNIFFHVLFFRVDVILLRALKSDVSVGYYNQAYKFADGLNVVPTNFVLAIFPLLSRYAATPGESLRRAFAISVKLLLIVSVPVTVGLAVLSERIVVFFLGDSFQPSAMALSLLILFLPFSFVNSITHYVLIALDQQRYVTWCFVATAAFNVTANLLLIPAYDFRAAAVVTMLSEVFLLVPFYRRVKRYQKGIGLDRLALRPILASAVMALVLSWLSWLNLLVLVVVGGVVYAAALMALGTFTHEDLELARSLLRRRRGEAAEPATGAAATADGTAAG